MVEKASEQGAEMRGFCLGFEKRNKKKSSSIQVIHMTTNGREVYLEPEFFISSHQIRQCLWVKNNKTNSKARQRESDQTQTPLAVFWYSGLVKCISQTLYCQGHHPSCDLMWWSPSQVLKGHPGFISIPEIDGIYGKYPEMDISLNTFQSLDITTLSL